MITKEMKISDILNKYPETLEVFVRISPHFKKLENKLLRKALASRVNVEQAASIANVDLKQLLYELNKAIDPEFQMHSDEKDSVNEQNTNEYIPDWLINFPEEKIIELDVRQILQSGKDPFLDIMKKVKELKENEILLIINSFEPIPLYSVLAKKGFEHYTKKEGNIFKVFFSRSTNLQKISEDKLQKKEAKLEDYEKVIEIDVRDLTPPEPMIKVLETLSQVDEKTLLLVHHHREPLMLYPKLEERGNEAKSYKINENYFKVLITKKGNR